MKTSFKENLIWTLVICAFLVLGFGLLTKVNERAFLAQIFSSKKVAIELPRAGQELKTGEIYQIAWTSRSIEKVGIVLFKGEEPKWIAENLLASDSKYEWGIFNWQEPSEDYYIAVFDYPWTKGNKIAYVGPFTIVGPKIISCDNLSTEAEWPFLSSDYPDLIKVFITKGAWTGNLGGLEGADEKCQAEAEKKGFSGTWKAFLGDDRILAKARLELDGVFVEAEVSATLPEGKTCHRLLGKDFNELLEKFSILWIINREKLSEGFLNNLSNLWLGKIIDTSKKDCLIIDSQYASKVLSEGYSFTTTCQNWTQGTDTISGYSRGVSPSSSFPQCYTSSGARIYAVALGGLSSGLSGGGTSTNSFSPSQGKYCDTEQKLLCVEQQ